ncbi:transcriptional activator MetR [Neisseria gonorrhoeae]|uniref:Transcriptional activator MetR n=1 Tax=Neisseria gonorrhoeae TaxID=485 RepID=A0A378W3K8_NEIGO|nr:transcriptional activator MetR [Neisseria gonorrhoeae]
MPAMGEFRPMWPQVELDIVSGFQADPVGLLLQHRADLAIVSEAENKAASASTHCLPTKWSAFAPRTIRLPPKRLDGGRLYRGNPDYLSRSRRDAGFTQKILIPKTSTRRAGTAS